MTPITLRRHERTLLPESARVIIRPFIPSSALRVRMDRTEPRAQQAAGLWWWLNRYNIDMGHIVTAAPTYDCV